jgi:hypothetical protein
VNTLCNAALTNPSVGLAPGDYGVATGTTRFWGAQLEVGTYPGPYIPTTATSVARAATVASVPLADIATSDTWCVGATAVPGASRTWVNSSTTEVLGIGDVGTANSAYIHGTNAGVFDSAATQKYTTISPSSGSHRFVLCTVGGSATVYIDGAGTALGSGTGTNLFSANPAQLRVGSASAITGFFDGSITNVKVYPNATYRAGM